MEKGYRELRKKRGNSQTLAPDLWPPIPLLPSNMGWQEGGLSPPPSGSPRPDSQQLPGVLGGVRKAARPWPSSLLFSSPVLASQLPAQSQHPMALDRPPGDCSQEVPRFQSDISQKLLVASVSS